MVRGWCIRDGDSRARICVSFFISDALPNPMRSDVGEIRVDQPLEPAHHLEHGHRDVQQDLRGASRPPDGRQQGRALPSIPLPHLPTPRPSASQVGGSNGSTAFNDVWSSADGNQWTRIAANASFSARSLPCVVSYSSPAALLVMGGVQRVAGNIVNYLSDVWSSPDGCECPWLIHTCCGADFCCSVVPSPPLPLRFACSLAPTWACAVAWTQVTASASWGGRYAHACAHFNRAWWLFGGLTPSPTNDVYYSTDTSESTCAPCTTNSRLLACFKQVVSIVVSCAIVCVCDSQAPGPPCDKHAGCPAGGQV